MEDARFEDGTDEPLRLKARDQEDLLVLSSLLQDAVLPLGEMLWEKDERRFALLLNRFRWEDVDRANLRGRTVERVQSVLVLEDVTQVQTQGLDFSDKEVVLSLLSLSFDLDEHGGGRLVFTLAGDGAIAVEVELLEATLKDVTRPYLAPSRQTPQHDD